MVLKITLLLDADLHVAMSEFGLLLPGGEGSMTRAGGLSE